MKKLFIILSLLYSTVFAAEYVEKWLELVQKDGSKVILHLDRCKKPGLGNVAMHVAPDNRVVAGCWVPIASVIYIDWVNGETMAYDHSLFQRKEYKWKLK